MSNELVAQVGTDSVVSIVNAVKNIPVMKTEDAQFLMDHSSHLGMVMEKVFMWRTDIQKESIINDQNFPTDKSKFHQCILEQKVQFDQTMYLAKEFEDKKLEIEGLQLDLEELDEEDAKEMTVINEDGTVEEPKPSVAKRRRDIKRQGLMLDLQFAKYGLEQMRIAMNYRMDEVKGWQVIEERLLDQMRSAGMTDYEIWDKNSNELRSMFFYAMANVVGVQKSTEAGEFNNLMNLGIFVYQQAAANNVLNEYKKIANPSQATGIAMVEQFMRQAGIQI